MKDYLVDVPVKVNIWIRQECQKKQFEVIKKARPSILFIQSDGGRNEDEWKAIMENRKIFDERIDWKCTVYRLYEDKNLGLYTMAKKTNDFVFSVVDRCIFLEDDQIPSVSFFQYCAELLERYKDDLRIECICGMNHLGICEDVTSDYFFSRQGSIWGTAFWKRVYDEYNKYTYYSDKYVMRLLRERTKTNRPAWKKLNAYALQNYYDGHIPFDEFWTEFHMYAQNRLQIVPKYNLISNIGATSDATHASSIEKMPPHIRRVFNMKTYELSFPLTHAEYVIPDIQYEKERNRIMHYSVGGKIKNVIYKLFSFDVAYFSKNITRLFKKNYSQSER